MWMCRFALADEDARGWLLQWRTHSASTCGPRILCVGYVGGAGLEPLDRGLHRATCMKTTLRVLALALLSITPAWASAQSVIVVVDPGPVRMNVRSMRADIAEASERTVVHLADEASREADETLTIARVDVGAWVLRHQRGTRVTWVERRDVAAGALRATLIGAAAELLRMDEASAEVASPPTPERVAASTEIPAEPRAVTDGTGPGHDLVDPFAAQRWDPLETAVGNRLNEPFERAPERGGLSLDLADPFEEIHASHLSDPWAE